MNARVVLKDNRSEVIHDVMAISYRDVNSDLVELDTDIDFKFHLGDAKEDLNFHGEQVLSIRPELVAYVLFE